MVQMMVQIRERPPAAWGVPSKQDGQTATAPKGRRYLERSLARYWRDYGTSLPPLACDDGTSLRVLYPGRESAAAGPDFRDAVLQRADGTIIRGDVELHLRRGGWEAHGHHRDRAYNGVALHVVLHGGGDGAPIRLASGERPPTAALFPRTLGRRGRASPPTPPQPALPEAPSPAAARPLPLAALPRAPARLARLLDREGDARFLHKTRRFTVALQRGGDGAPAQALYAGLLGGLGYGGNSAAMEQLAEGLPLRALARALRGVPPHERRGALTAALLQASGLAAATSPSGAHGQLPPQGQLPVVAREAWRLFRVRPANHPARRLEGLAAFLDAAWDHGLPAWAAALVRTGAVARVRDGLTVRGGRGAVIGASRAADLAVNVLLPFARAWGNATGDRALAATALSLYRAWPPLQENAITAEALRLLAGDGDPDVVRALQGSARRQQGLIGLYRRRLGADAG